MGVCSFSHKIWEGRKDNLKFLLLIVVVVFSLSFPSNTHFCFQYQHSKNCFISIPSVSLTNTTIIRIIAPKGEGGGLIGYERLKAAGAYQTF